MALFFFIRMNGSSFLPLWVSLNLQAIPNTAETENEQVEVKFSKWHLDPLSLMKSHLLIQSNDCSLRGSILQSLLNWLITAILQVHCDCLSIEDRCQLIKWKNKNSQRLNPSPGEIYDSITMEISTRVYLRTLVQVWVPIWILTSWSTWWVWFAIYSFIILSLVAWALKRVAYMGAVPSRGTPASLDQTAHALRDWALW